MFDYFKNHLGPRARLGLYAGAACIVAATAAMAFWLFRTDYQVLFTRLSPADAAAMVAEIERQKLPYQLEDNGSTVLVPAELVHRTRLKLVSTEIPLQGAVGLELFNNSEIGMTEFAQKINYQRAQQGELTRTIQSIEGVQSARVHLALPEQGLFKRSSAQPKASITVAMKPGHRLEQEQVRGIQRLVAAALPEVRAESVTIVDQQGVALTRSAPEGDEPDAGAAVELKRSMEAYLGRKLNAMLEQNFGPDQSIATVDVQINADKSRTTTENVLPAGAGARPAGVVVREKTASRDDPAASGANNSHDTEYQVGRKVEQVVAASNGVRRLSAVVVIRKSLSLEQLEHVRQLVALAIGIDAARGDAVAVFSADQVAGRMLVPREAAPPALPEEAAPAAPAGAAAQAAPRQVLGILVPVLLALLAGAAALAFLRRRAGPAAPANVLLSGAERERALAQVRHWLELEPGMAKEQR